SATIAVALSLSSYRLIWAKLRYPKIDVDEHMAIQDSGIRILSLSVNNDRILWSLSKIEAQMDYRQALAKGEEDFDLNPLARDTIDFLAQHLQLLADNVRDNQLPGEV